MSLTKYLNQHARMNVETPATDGVAASAAPAEPELVAGFEVAWKQSLPTRMPQPLVVHAPRYAVFDLDGAAYLHVLAVLGEQEKYSYLKCAFSNTTFQIENVRNFTHVLPSLYTQGYSTDSLIRLGVAYQDFLAEQQRMEAYAEQLALLAEEIEALDMPAPVYKAGDKGYLMLSVCPDNLSLRFRIADQFNSADLSFNIASRKVLQGFLYGPQPDSIFTLMDNAVLYLGEGGPIWGPAASAVMIQFCHEVEQKWDSILKQAVKCAELGRTSVTNILLREVPKLDPDYDW